MERSIISKFQRLQVLPSFDFQTMDELVHDLTTALEESSRSTTASKFRKRRGLKRRSKPTTSVVSHEITCGVSDDSQSSLDEAQNSRELLDSLQPTDSDDVSPAGCMSVLNYLRWQTPHVAGNFVESDSVNENFSPVRPHRRKRKFKRMAVDPSPLVSSDHQIPVQCEKRNKSIKVLKHRSDIENMYRNLKIDTLDIMCGKRKRSMRERSVEFVSHDLPGNEPCHSTLLNDIGTHRRVSKMQSGSKSDDQHYILKMRHRRDDGECMDCSDFDIESMVTERQQNIGEPNLTGCKQCGESSCSSLSSSESDAGIYTNDEGREGDDEQSDFYHEPDPACGVPGVLPWWENDSLGGGINKEEMDPEFQAILTGSFQHMSWRAQQAFQERISKLDVPGRELRSGRRRLHDRRPGFSIVTSFNEKISKFLQDPDQNELRLHPVKKKERDQLNYLASLYSLNMRSEGSRKNKYPVLTKTRNTTQAVCVDHINLSLHTSVNDIKRRRKTPPPIPVAESVVGGSAEPIGENNVGNLMLRNMGWKPGSGLGSNSTGMRLPVKAVIRPKLLGLGYGSKANSS